MGVLVARQGEQIAPQEDAMVGSEQGRLLLLTSMLGVAEHDLVSAQDRLNAMHQLQLEKDQELMKKERQVGSLHNVRPAPMPHAPPMRTTIPSCSPSSASAVPFGGTSGPCGALFLHGIACFTLPCPEPIWYLQENERFRTQLEEIMKVLAEYTSKRSAPQHESEGTPESKAALKVLKEAHQKRLLRTFDSHSLERQYVSLSAEAEHSGTDGLMRPGELALEQPRIANEVR